MSETLKEIIQFRGDRLFHGAVSIGWLDADEEKAKAAARSFVFHGPAYHGVSQTEVGTSHGHRLEDTASFARSIVERCYGIKDQPFTLAIAGYGTGKSHLGLTLAGLLRAPGKELAEEILQRVAAADATIASHVRSVFLEHDNQPCLVVALNGMQSFDLASEIMGQVFIQVQAHSLDTTPLDGLRRRFAHAARLINMTSADPTIADELIAACGMEDIEAVLHALERQDDVIYSAVHEVFAAKGFPISAVGGESVKDIIDVVTREYCGDKKTFRSLVILFDEFGRYTEFATVKSHVAGSGALQTLFEGVQENAPLVSFVGFIQFELNAYVQRVALEHRNEILRYISRYQGAARSYLSINLETLIASLIEKTNPTRLNDWFDDKKALDDSCAEMANIGKWFPQSGNHHVWTDEKKFHSVIRKGCWPLSSYSTWLLFQLASGGKHLQERSALTLLGRAFEKYAEYKVPNERGWCLSPVDLWSDELENELLSAENAGAQGSVTHAYASVMARHGSKFEPMQIKLMRAIVLGSKLGFSPEDRDDAVDGLSELAGIHLHDADRAITELHDEFNVLEWDPGFKSFEILGDGVPRNQFLSFIRQRVIGSFDAVSKSRLFATKIQTWCDLLGDVECDFAEENQIRTREWWCKAVTSNLEYLLIHVQDAAARWKDATGVNDPRGAVIYCYVEAEQDLVTISKDATKLLKAIAHTMGCPALPILIVFMQDEDGVLGQSMAELAVLRDSLTEEERAKFGSLVGGHEEKLKSTIRMCIERMIKERHYVSGYSEPFEARRLGRVTTEMFSRIYRHPLPFPFDGFSTAKGNAAGDCQEMTNELLLGRLDWGSITAKPIKFKNRAVAVLKDSWDIFANNGNVRTRPSHSVVRNITEKWDKLLSEGEKRLQLRDGLSALCAPPYGANQASAGLFLGVFLAARINKIVLMRDGSPLSVSDLINEGLYLKGLLNFELLSNIELQHAGDDSSEWASLLDEWEEAESHSVRRSCWLRANELQEKISVPPAQAYRKIHLESLAQHSVKEMARMDESLSKALGKIEWGASRDDVAQLSWGGAELLKLISLMESQQPLWTQQEIESVRPDFERSRQLIIRAFSGWLIKQLPREGTLDAVGEFKHKMKDKVGGSLKKLQLTDQVKALDEHTDAVLRRVGTITEAQQATKEVNLWIQTNQASIGFAKVLELRRLCASGKEYSNKLKALSSKVNMDVLTESREKLAAFLVELTKHEKTIASRLGNLSNAKLETMEDLDTIQFEVDTLADVFAGCPDELIKLQDLQRALKAFKQGQQALANDQLSCLDFESTLVDLKSRLTTEIDTTNVPWNPEIVLDSFAKDVSASREQISASWIEGYESELSDLEMMSAAEANRLYSKAENPPRVLTVQHNERLCQAKRRIENRLNKLKVSWLLEKYQELSEGSRLEFKQGLKQIDN